MMITNSDSDAKIGVTESANCIICYSRLLKDVINA